METPGDNPTVAPPAPRYISEKYNDEKSAKLTRTKNRDLVWNLQVPGCPLRSRKVFCKLREHYRRNIDLLVDALDTLARAKGIDPQAVDKYTRKLAKLNPQVDANLDAIVDLPKEEKAPFDIPAGSLAELTD